MMLVNLNRLTGPTSSCMTLHGITTDTFDVVYNDDDTVTVTYDDDLTDSVALSLDRANAPQGAMVHLTISDTRLNLDPTGVRRLGIGYQSTDNDESRRPAMAGFQRPMTPYP